MILGVIFDLDGVIVSTDDCHYNGWKRVADEEEITFTPEQGHCCRGVSRMESLEIVLKNANRQYSEAEKSAIAMRKNEYYLQYIQAITPENILPGVMSLLGGLRQRGILQAIGSSSRNTPTILNQIGLDHWFDAVADGNDIKRSKPDPEVFLLAAHRLGLSPQECLVVEDAAAGVEAGVAGGFKVIGVGVAAGHPDSTFSAASLERITADDLLGARHA